MDFVCLCIVYIYILYCKLINCVCKCKGQSSYELRCRQSMVEITLCCNVNSTDKRMRDPLDLRTDQRRRVSITTGVD